MAAYIAQADNVALSGFPHILLGTKANDRMAFEGVDVTRRDCRKSEPFANAFAIGYVLVSRDRLALTLYTSILLPRTPIS